MASFDRAVLIFNPNSTGNAQEKAQELRDELSVRLPELLVELVPTQHAGHARDLARDAAATGRPLIISVSGDGGYNEVVDGESSYAHSYIGLGLTPAVAVDLEKSGKGSLRELVTTVRAFAQFRPFEIERPDRTRERFDSIIFANIDQMAKVATLSEDDGRPDDGAFEVITMRHTAKWKLLGTALRASTRGLGPQPSATEYVFTTIKAMPIQIDGEVLDLDARAQVRIDIAPKALRTVL
jgi:diacylglycerol kinase family enzyme